MARDHRIALDDMIVAMDRIAEVTEADLRPVRRSWRVQYIVERALLIVSESEPRDPAIVQGEARRYPLDRRSRYRQRDPTPIRVAVAVTHLERRSRRAAAAARRHFHHP
jgi:hypothetical protein